MLRNDYAICNRSGCYVDASAYYRPYMVTPPRYNEPAVVTTCIGYVLACNARYMAAKACGDGRPHGTATFEGGVLGEDL